MCCISLELPKKETTHIGRAIWVNRHTVLLRSVWASSIPAITTGMCSIQIKRFLFFEGSIYRYPPTENAALERLAISCLTNNFLF